MWWLGWVVWQAGRPTGREGGREGGSEGRGGRGREGEGGREGRGGREGYDAGDRLWWSVIGGAAMMATPFPT